MKTSELLVKFIFNAESKYNSKYNNNWAMYKLLEHYYFIANKIQRDEAQ